MTNFHNSPEFQMGRVGELTFAAWLRARGNYVIASYDFTGSNGDKAPRLLGLSRNFVIPDLDVAKGGVRSWLEAKTKTAPSFTWKTGQDEHGINERHARDYLHVQKETGTPVWIGIYEFKDRILLAQSLERLMEHSRAASMYGCPMRFFPRSAFRILERNVEPVQPSTGKG